jgi:hypothetical protein
MMLTRIREEKEEPYVSIVRKVVAALALTGLLVSTAPVAQAHTPGIRWRARALRFEQVAETKSRVLVAIAASSRRTNFVVLKCKVRPAVRVQDPATGLNTWYQATWRVRWRVRPLRTSSHAWWLGIEHPPGTANGWRLDSMTCHA